MTGLSLEEKKKLLAELLKKTGKSAPRLFPLASGQKALWLLHQQDPEGAAYNTPFALRIRSEVDAAALRRAFEMLAERHPSLRTTFTATPDGQLLQTVHPTLPPHFAQVDANGWTAEQLYASVVRAYRHPFSLERGPLMRGDLFTVAPDDHVLLITVHHIVYDGWSAGIIQRELSQIYLALSKGGDPQLGPVTGTYADFVAKQAEVLASPAGRAHWDYWHKKLSGELPALALPTDRARSAEIENRSGSCPIKLDAELTAAVKALAGSEHATPFVVLASAYSALLGRLSRQDDVLIGTPTTGRSGVALHEVVGYFANPVVLRADLSGDPSARGLVGRMRSVVLEALAHQDYPFASLVERLEIARRPGVSPIFQASITFQSSREGGGAMDLWASGEEEARIRWGHVELEPYPIKDIEGQFDLTLEMWEARGVLQGTLRYNRDLFDESTVRLWRGYFEKLLAEMVKRPDEPITALSLEEASSLRDAQAAPAVATARVTTINGWFESQVAKTPQAIALSFNDTRLTYAELNARANVLAHELQTKGVGPESLVGVCVDRTAELVIAILAVVKAGGAYVPLDPASPKDRLALILEDAEVSALVTETKRQNELPTGKVPTLYVDAVDWQKGQRAENPKSGVEPHNAAYVIYTSGSTGKPKGVIVTHANCTRLFTATEGGMYDFGPNDVWTLFHSAAFDFSVWELWGPLFYGGRLVVVPYWMTRSPEAFGDLIAREGVTVLNQTPSAFRALCRAPSIADGKGGRSLRWIIFGGEALDAATIRPWFEAYPNGGTKLINMYGITETTVHVTYRRMTEADLASSASPIGVPIPDLEIRLLDENQKPVPVGVPGEMYVGGGGVARGYLKRPELTAKRFVPDPLSPDKKLYRSGDLAIRNQDGTYNYLGRIDDQVKIRGFRIELGEIQSLIAEHSAVAEAYVNTYERSADDRRIVAYVVPKEGASEMVLSQASDSGIGETHVGEWKELYDQLYARSESEDFDPSFNIAGWNSSYGGAALSAEAMKEWVDRTVEQILARKPSRVLEIGCGTGLLLTRIAPHTDAYWGTDVSGVVVDMVGRLAKKNPDLRHARLFPCPADQLERIDFEGDLFDTVIINSVVQYFPSAEYLARVLELASKHVRKNGCIFVGDVRNHRLLEAFHASIIFAESSGTIDPKALKERLARRLAAEEELVLDPDFFWALKKRLPRISHVEVRPKRGMCMNELTRFRCDVLLHVDAEVQPAKDVMWGPGNMSLLELRARLSVGGPPRIGLRGIRNSRVQAALEAAACVTDPSSVRAQSLEKLRRRVLDRDGSTPAAEAEPGIDPDALHQLAEALGLDVALDWSRGGADGSFDAVFTRRAVSGPAYIPLGSTRNLPAGMSVATTKSPPAGTARSFPASYTTGAQIVASLRSMPATAASAAIEIDPRRPVALFGTIDDPTQILRAANDPLRGRLERRLEGELRKKAQERLPDYMVPASIMVVDRIPLTENGKVDRRALPVPVAPQDLGTAYVDPRTGEEEILASVFAELLGAERVGVHDSFFDLGGHSLLATQVISRIRAVFGVDLPLRALFDSPTVGGLAAAVQKLRSSTAGAAGDLTSPVERPAEIPLSSAQERMWILDRVEETRAPIYIIPLLLRLRGPLDREALKKSLALIVERHEVLRTTFPMQGEKPVQSISDEVSLDLPCEDLAHPAGTSEADLLAIIQEQAGLEVSRPFDLARGPLLRTRLFRISESDHVLVVTMHHIVSDGWSIGVIARELSAAYNAIRSSREPAFQALPIQYADFSIWQRKLFEEGALSASIEAMKKRLAGAPPSLELPTDRPRPPAPSFQGGVVRFSIDRALTTRLKDLSRREGATLYMTLLAAFSAYLSRVSGQRDLVLGSPVANRNRAAIEPLVGFFVNTLALRVDLEGEPTFLELLDRVRKTTLDAYADQDVPFEKLVEAISPERSLNRQPIVQAMFVLQNAPFSPPALDGLSVDLLDLDSITAKFDLTLSMQETADGLSALFEYSSELFDRDRIERMAEHFGVILRAIVDQPKQRLRELGILSEAEERAIAAWSEGGPSPATARTLLEMFDAHRARSPEAAALVLGDTQVSYAELDRRATRLAQHLASIGVHAESIVAISLERSIEMIVAVLAVWKAGAAYLPIDPEYPKARIEHMLEDSKCEFLLTSRALEGRSRFTGRTVRLDDPLPATGDPRPLSPPGDRAAAYVIYTSGSTGKPKGVVLEHRGLANIAAVEQRLFGVGPKSAVLQFASFSFDASVWEIAMALGSGGRLVLSADETARAGEGLGALLAKHRITHATLPPSTLAALPGEAYPDLEVIISAGEACTRELAKKWITAKRRFINAYGPTETTICATAGEVSPNESGPPSIGKPLPGLVARILDRDQRIAPIGVPGELYAGGIGVGRGYLHQEALTKERFVSFLGTPFAVTSQARPGTGLGSERLYRTGDLARWRADGTIEFLGRLDHQVKLRGYRIELGEVESVLESHPNVQQAHALVRGAQLVAYVIGKPGQAITPAPLREHAHSRLPDYMVPSHFVLIDAFPLTPNGKIDRAKLPDPASAQPKAAFVAASSSTEQILSEIWAAVLKKESVGIHDNFFALGGDSILGLQIIARATQRGLRLRPRQLFQHQTIAELAKVAADQKPIQAEQGPVMGAAPLSPIQRWFFEQDRSEAHHFNMAMLLEVDASIDRKALRRALDVIDGHHDALRLRYRRGGEGAWQQIHAPPTAGAIPLSEIKVAGENELSVALGELHRTLDLERGPLMRAAMIEVGGSARLALVAHHLVVDAVSWGIILEDLLTTYDALAKGRPVELQPKTTSFKDWSTRLETYAGSADLQAELDAWLVAADPDLANQLPLEDAQARDTVEDASTIATWLDPEETKALLGEVPKAYDVKVNEALISALARSLAAWTGQGSVRIDLEGHGREQLFEDADLSRTVGWFTSLFPLRVRVGAKESPRETLARVKDALRRNPHGGIGYGILRHLSPDPSIRARLAKGKLSGVVFNYLGQLGAIPPNPVVRAAAKEGTGPLHSPRALRPHRLEINAIVEGDRLRISWTFGSEVFSAETIERLSAQLIANTRVLIRDRAQPAAAVRVAADFPAARLSAKDLQKVLGKTQKPR
jgi:amino acid adenylation domain-containing protein/non-ribosomal peptide synthase protein (TIGR01720 family)